VELWVRLEHDAALAVTTAQMTPLALGREVARLGDEATSPDVAKEAAAQHANDGVG
jgi:hypothetical protein